MRWLGWLNREKKRSVFVKFALSYMLILFLPIGIGINLYFKTERVLVDDATELNLQILRTSQDIVDRLFLEVDGVVSALSVDTDVLNLLQDANAPPNAEQIYRFSLLRNSLNRYVTTNKFFFDIFICYNNAHSVVTSKTLLDLADNDIRIGGQLFAEWIADAADRNNPKRYYKLDDVSLGSQSRDLIAYIDPLPDGFQGKVDGSIVIVIDQQDITSQLRRLVAKNGGFAYILDNQGQLIASTFSEPGTNRLQLPSSFSQTSGASFERLNGDDMLVSYSRSDQNGWTYVAALPTSVVLERAEYIKRMIVVITLITLGLGIIVALLLAYRNSKPLSELMDSVKEFVTGENGKRANVYEILQKTVTDIINNNRMLNIRMEQHLPLLQMSVQERLLRGNYKNEEEAKAAIDQAKIAFRGECYFAVALIVCTEEMPFGAYAGTKEVQDFIVRRMRDLLDGFDYLICINGGKADLIVSLTGRQAEMQRESLKQKWKLEQSSYQEENGMRLTIGVGRLTDRLCEVWRSHNEARQALECHVAGDQSSAIRPIWYEDLAQGSSFYYYPPDLELKLIHTVKNGDLDALDHLLQHLGDENHTQRRLNGATMKQLLNEIQGTLHKLLEQMEFGSDTYAELSDKLGFLHQSESDVSWASLTAALRIICSHVAENKRRKYNKMADAMMEIIHGQFMDSNFSLASLAGHFKLSESFISMLFKEHAGENFSDYVEKLRMEQACKLLKETEKTINDIALEIGYNSDKTFRRAFKRVIGIQPTSYRHVKS